MSGALPAQAQTPPTRGIRLLIQNMGWVVFQRGSAVLLGLLATAWVTRYLTPDQLGTLALASSIVTYFGFLASGLDFGVMARMILHEPEREGAIMGGSTMVLAILGVVSWLLLLAFLSFFSELNGFAKGVTLIVGLRLLLIFPAPYAVWLYSREKLKYTVLANTFSSLFLRLFQIGVVLSKGSLIYIALAEFLSLLINGSYCRWAYLRHGGRGIQWTYRLKDGLQVWWQSLPALIAASLFLLMLKLDVIMLQALRGMTETGYFSAAAALSESLQFLATLLAMPLGPRIMNAYKTSPEKYEALKKLYYQLSALMGLGCALSLSLGSRWIIEAVYGEAYAASAPVMQVHAFMLLPCFVGAGHMTFLVVERKARYMTLFLGVAILTNLLSNFLLVPKYGGVGAGYSTLVGVTMAYLFMPWGFRDTRELALLACRSLIFPFPRWSKLRSTLSA